MKIFLDKGKTILPRVDSLFLISRFLILIGIIWIVMYSDLSRQDLAILGVLAFTYLVTMAVFTKLVKDERLELKKAHLAVILFDLLFINVLIYTEGGFNSDFYLLLYLNVMFAAYLLTFPATLIFLIIVSSVYFAGSFNDLTINDTLSVALRIGMMWFLSMAIKFVSDFVRRSEKRLLKLLNTLNRRTTELERSQAHVEMIYENSRILAGILDIDGVVEGVMHITSKILDYSASSLLLISPDGQYIYRGRNVSGKISYHLKVLEEDKSVLIRRIAHQTEPVTIVDISKRDDYQVLHKKAKSALIIPMIAHGRTIGMLTAESVKVGGFAEKDLKILSIVARSAAMALENASLHKKTEELTITDELTGIYNYRYFASKLKEEQRRAARYEMPLSMIMLDIDWFKKFNDTYGHEIGNIVLQGVTAVVKECIRDVDIFARYGGEEFVIILPQTPQNEVAQIGERIREHIAETIFGGTGEIPELHVTVSVGITSYPENGKTEDELLPLVDKALYKAKGSGKNKVCVV